MNEPPACETLHSSPFTDTAFSVERERERPKERGEKKDEGTIERRRGYRERETKRVRERKLRKF